MLFGIDINEKKYTKRFGEAKYLSYIYIIKLVKTKIKTMQNLSNTIVSTFLTILGTFTASTIVYTWCYAIAMYC